MANKDLFKQAIAEAKSVREAAIANAKEALEETLTPQLKDFGTLDLHHPLVKIATILTVRNRCFFFYYSWLVIATIDV